MLFTIFCCFSTGLVVYCILKRVHREKHRDRRQPRVREVEKEYEGRNDAMIAQLNAEEGELIKARNLVKLHEAVPTMPRAAPATAAKLGATKPVARPTGSPPAKLPERKLKQDPLNVFEMSRPFTFTRRTTRCWPARTSSRSSRPAVSPALPPRGDRADAVRAPAGRTAPAPLSQAMRRATAGGRSPSQRRACCISALVVVPARVDPGVGADQEALRHLEQQRPPRARLSRPSPSVRPGRYDSSPISVGCCASSSRTRSTGAPPMPVWAQISRAPCGACAISWSIATSSTCASTDQVALLRPAASACARSGRRRWRCRRDGTRRGRGTGRPRCRAASSRQHHLVRWLGRGTSRS